MEGHLIQGYSTSPVLANIVSIELDLAIMKYIPHTVTYTRYADDMYFSTDDLLPNIKELESIINNHGFKINPLKTQIMKQGQKQFVTGLSVSDKNYPRIPKKIKRNLRLEAYFINKYGYEGYKGYISPKRITGWIKFINSIEPIFAQKLKKQLPKLK